MYEYTLHIQYTSYSLFSTLIVLLFFCTLVSYKVDVSPGIPDDALSTSRVRMEDGYWSAQFRLRNISPGLPSTTVCMLYLCSHNS